MTIFLKHTQKVPFQSYSVGRETEAGLHVERENVHLLMDLSNPVCLFKAWEHAATGKQVVVQPEETYMQFERISRRQMEVVESQRPCLNTLGNFSAFWQLLFQK